MNLPTRIGLGVALAAVPCCAADPCQTFATNVTACPEFVDINSTSSSASTGTTTPTQTCTDKQQTEAKCLLDSGLDVCTVVFHPEKLTAADQKVVQACAASM